MHGNKKAEIKRESIYRKSIWNGKGFWQGAAWFLERKYPEQFAKPEIQLAINNNTLNQTINQTLVVSAEVAGVMASRVKAAESKIDVLIKAKRGNGNGNGQGNDSPCSKPQS